MAYFQWSPALSMNIKSLDREHRESLDLAKWLHTMITEGKSPQEIRDVLPQLIALEKRHFAREEELMLKYDFPDYTRHQQVHNELTRGFAELYDRLCAAEPVGSLLLRTFLQDQLINHILGLDKELGDFLADKIRKNTLT